MALIEKADADPECGGVVINKKPYVGITALHIRTLAWSLKKGKITMVGTQKENKPYIDNVIKTLLSKYDLDCGYKNMYARKRYYSDEEKFIGWEIFIKQK